MSRVQEGRTSPNSFVEVSKTCHSGCAMNSMDPKLWQCVRSSSLQEATKNAVELVLAQSHADMAAIVYGVRELRNRMAPRFGSIARYPTRTTGRTSSTSRNHGNKHVTMISEELDPYLLQTCQAETEFLNSELDGQVETNSASSAGEWRDYNLGSHLCQEKTQTIMWKGMRLDEDCHCILELLYFHKDDVNLHRHDSAAIKNMTICLEPILEKLFWLTKKNYTNELERALSRATYKVVNTLCSEQSLKAMVDSVRKLLAAKMMHVYQVIERGDTEVKAKDIISNACYTADKSTVVGYCALEGTVLNMEASSEWKTIEGIPVNRKAKYILSVPLFDSESGAPIAVVEAMDRYNPFNWTIECKRSESCVDGKKAAKNGTWAFSSQDEGALLDGSFNIRAALEANERIKELEIYSLTHDHILNLLRTAAVEEPQEIFETISKSASQIVGSKEVCVFLVRHDLDDVSPLIIENGNQDAFIKKLAQEVATTGARRSMGPGTSSDDICAAVAEEPGANKYVSLPIHHPSFKHPLAVLQVVDHTNGYMLNPLIEAALEQFCHGAGLALGNIGIGIPFAWIFDQGKFRQPQLQPPKVSSSSEDWQRGTGASDFSLVQEYTHAASSKSLRKYFSSRSLASLRENQEAETSSQFPGETPISPKCCLLKEAAKIVHAQIAEDDPLFHWSFNCLDKSIPELKQTVAKILNYWNFVERLRVPQEKLALFIDRVYSFYNDCYFHNFYHAIDTMHTTFLIVGNTRAIRVLKELDIFATLIAALCHDIDHPGHSQTLEINRQSALALRYNDITVLESYHAQKTFEILQQDSTDIFCNMSPEQYQYCRKSIIQSILGTSMSNHFSHIQSLASRKAKLDMHSMSSTHRGRSPCNDRMDGTVHFLDGSIRGDPFDREEDDDRLELSELIVHAADLTGQASPFEEARQWGERIVEEFKRERFKHEEEGFKPPAFMTKINNRCEELSLQSSFITNIVLPLWELMNDVLSNLDQPVQYLRMNRERYAMEAAEH